jgi:hypothetical protein
MKIKFRNPIAFLKIRRTSRYPYHARLDYANYTQNFCSEFPKYLPNSIIMLSHQRTSPRSLKPCIAIFLIRISSIGLISFLNLIIVLILQNSFSLALPNIPRVFSCLISSSLLSPRNRSKIISLLFGSPTRWNRNPVQSLWIRVVQISGADIVQAGLANLTTCFFLVFISLCWGLGTYLQRPQRWITVVL